MDTSFDPGTGFNSITNPYGTVAALVLQPDGKIIVGGSFSSFNGVAHNGVVRLNTDGSLDTGFNVSVAGVSALALLSNGKVLIGGGFSTVNGVYRSNIARLNADGSLDISFNSLYLTNSISGSISYIQALAVQSDGKILIGGNFTTVNSVARINVARLNADGFLDSGFNSSSGATGAIYALALQSNGKVMICGYSTVGGASRSRLERINADGTVDNSFANLLGASSGSSALYAMAVQSNGQIITGGYLNVVLGGPAFVNLARLYLDGYVDNSFSSGLSIDNPVRALAVQGDDKILVGGSFSVINGALRNGIARLNANGLVDASFTPGLATGSGVSAIAVQGNGRVVIGGGFSNIDGVARASIARLNGDGSSGSLQFSAASYSVNESAGTATISVSRTAGSIGAVSIRYATANSTAIAGTDYQSASGTLFWPDGDIAAKIFTVPINDRGLTDGSVRTLALTLSAAAGGAAIGSPAAATLTINENDPSVSDLIQAVNLLSPPTNLTVLAGQALDLYVSVDAIPGALRGVEFFADNLSLGGSSAARDRKTWTPPGAGDFTLRAVATDINGTQKASFETIHVVSPINNFTAPLSALLSGLDGKTFAVGSTVNVIAATSDAKGPLTNVQFYLDGKPLNTQTLDPNAHFANGGGRGLTRKDSLGAGLFQGAAFIANRIGDALVTIKATNGDGVSSISAGATIHMVQSLNDAAFSCAIASPSANGSLAARTKATAAVAAAKPGGQVSKVEFFVNSTSVGSAQNAPYDFVLPALEPGAYALTAIATDESGFNKVSAPVIVTATLAAGAAAPAVTSATVSAQVGVPFSYQIDATNTPTSYSANGLSAVGLSLDASRGIISGIPTQEGVIQIPLGAANATGAGTGTLAINVQAAPFPTITLTVSEPSVTAGSGQAGEFTPTRSGDGLSTDLIVHYLVKGSATPGVDYVALQGTKKMKAGKASIKLKVSPLGNLGGTAKKVVKLSLQPGDGYTVGTTAPLKVKILAP